MSHFCLIINAVSGRYANMLSTDARLNYFADMSTPYMDTTGICLELYYQLKSTANINKPVISVLVFDEESPSRYGTVVASSHGDNRTSWERMFAKLPDGFHRIFIKGRRSRTQYCGMSIDDVVVQPCEVFGKFFSYCHYH